MTEEIPPPLTKDEAEELALLMDTRGMDFETFQAWINDNRRRSLFSKRYRRLMKLSEGLEEEE